VPDIDAVRLERQDELGLLIMQSGVTNPIDEDLIDGLDRGLEAVRRDDGLVGLVLTGSNDKFFSIGLNLPQLIGQGRQETLAFYHHFTETCLALYTFPKPIIAALNGHAVAGGCILALCCDYRFLADGRRRMGLNEIHLGVPVPYVADCILRHLLGARLAREIVDGGQFYEAQDLLRMGLVDRTMPSDELRHQAGAKARELGRAPGGVFAKIKRDRTEGIEAEIRSRLAEKENDFLESWASPAVQASLAEAAKRF